MIRAHPYSATCGCSRCSREKKTRKTRRKHDGNGGHRPRRSVTVRAYKQQKARLRDDG